MHPDAIAVIVERYSGKPGALLSVLQAVQDTCGWLPPEALRLVASRMGRSLVDVYGVATFYTSFRLNPKGKHVICACVGTACHVRAAQAVVEELERQLGITAGETTRDGEFTLETVNCLGACALGPIVVVDGRYFSNVDPSRARHIIEQVRSGSPDLRPDGDEPPRHEERQPGRVRTVPTPDAARPGDAGARGSVRTTGPGTRP